MSFLCNAWYVAGWADEIGPTDLIGRRILGQHVLLFRSEDGKVNAIGNRCPHRFAPLHLGRHVGNAVQCGYHGLEFAADGRCVRNPHGNGATPSAAQVPSFSLVERHNLLWIWMGAETADENLIPDAYTFLSEPGRRAIKGHLTIQAGYELLVDNLMDLSHGLYLHQGSLATAEMQQDYRPHVYAEGDVVVMERESANMPPPLLWVPALPADMPRVDFFSRVSWHPASNTVHEVGCKRPGRPRDADGGISAIAAHIFTPETETTAHYFWSFTRTFAVDSEEIESHIRTLLQRAFANEDKPMIEAQAMMLEGADLMTLKPVLLPTDNAAVRVRRVMERLIADEQMPGPKSKG